MPAKPIVILTGAGISQESGLDTFRSVGGVWSRVKLEDVATPEGYQRNPALVHDFYNARRAQLESGDIQPNLAHLALARLEQLWPAPVLLVTQNIDDLHERAGSRSLIHMHGELMKGRCIHCAAVFGWLGSMSVQSECPCCGLAAGVRPHVVWFGEVPLQMEDIFHALENCGMFLSIGTSGNVYPAAGFVAHARQMARAETIELNMEPSQGASLFADAIYGPASQVVPDFVEELLRDLG